MNAEGRASSVGLDDWLLGAGVTLLLGCSALFLDSELWHWFMVPVCLSGILFAGELVAWLRGHLDALSPRAIVAAVAFHMYFAAPLLHVVWDRWPDYVVPARDWRAALGLLASINVLGIVLYRVVLGRPLPGSANKRPVVRSVDRKLFWRFWWIALAVSLTAYGAVLMKFGGPAQYLAAVGQGSDRADVLAGLGPLLLMGESFPAVLFLGFIVAARAKRAVSTPVLVVVFATFLLMQFGVAGVRGLRSHVVWPALIATALIHWNVRRVRARHLAAALIALIAFSYVYGFYKTLGAEAVRGAAEGNLSVLEESSNRDFEGLILHDFSRTDVQALVLDRQRSPAWNVPLAWGESYVASIGEFIPGEARVLNARGKVEIGTDLLHGQGTYAAGFRDTKIYGLVGESILNFGLLGVPVVWLILALVVRIYLRFEGRGFHDEYARLTYPFFLGALGLLVMSDAGNVMAYFIQYGLFCLTLLFISKVKEQSARDAHLA